MYWLIFQGDTKLDELVTRQAKSKMKELIATVRARKGMASEESENIRKDVVSG